MNTTRRVGIALALLTIAAACSSSGTSTGSDAPADTPTSEAPAENPGTTTEGGTLTLGDETIALGPGRCFLSDQDAAGGGTIHATAQASGTNAAGDEVRLDFTRFGDDTAFAGDDISVDIGELGASTSWDARLPSGTVSIDGRTVSAPDFVLMDDGEELTASFTINC